MTDAGRFNAVDELFKEALRLPKHEHDRFLMERCGSDAQLRREVAALLREDDLSRGALDNPAINEPLSLSRLGVLGGTQRAEPIPERIGRYRVVSRLGAGGMGVVYEAEQESPRRKVAVKVISQGLVSAATLRRFEHEAQLLGRLEHPGIARIYEAGVHDSAQGPRPFIAMELVRGVPVLEYVNQRAPKTRQRLELFAQVCDGVHHAHQRGVIHRDLKPANILVDDAGRPRILDFGVARAIDDEARATSRTDVEQIIGTLAYMSPEQAAGKPDDVDTRSDVYALGVLGYELLAGASPYDLRGKTIPEALRVVCDQEPAPISTINKSLRGDVQTIFAKALEKDKTRRYDSCAALADDVRRFLSDEAIHARPASAAYQLRKFAARHKAGVFAAAVVLVALLVALFVTADSLRKARAALARAERQTAIAAAVQSFLNEDLLGAADANRLGKDATIRAAIDAAAAKVDDRFKAEPIVAAAVHASLGGIYWSLGDLHKGEHHLLAAKSIHDREIGREIAPGDEIRLAVLNDLAGFYLEQFDADKAEALLNLSLPLCRVTFGPNATETLRAEAQLCRVYTTRGEFHRSEPLLLALLPRMIAHHGEASNETSMALTRLGVLYLESDRPALAEPYFARSLAIDRALSGEMHTKTLSALNNLAVTYEKLGRLEEAEAMLRDLTSREESLHGPHHPETLPSIYNLASVLFKQGRLREAEPLLTEVLAQCRKTFGDAHVGTIRTIGKLADLYASEKDYARAEPLMREAAELSARVFGFEHEEAAESRRALERLRKARAGLE